MLPAVPRGPLHEGRWVVVCSYGVQPRRHRTEASALREPAKLDSVICVTTEGDPFIDELFGGDVDVEVA